MNAARLGASEVLRLQLRSGFSYEATSATRRLQLRSGFSYEAASTTKRRELRSELPSIERVLPFGAVSWCGIEMPHHGVEV
ncbi:MAG: hypothetical protein ACKOUR_18435 [Planctomycetota bacterium]